MTGRYVSDYRLVLPGARSATSARSARSIARPTAAPRSSGVNWDVTADVRRARSSYAKRLEAEGASVAKSEFLATMSHEIPHADERGDRHARPDPEERARPGPARAGGDRLDSARQLLAILNDILDLSKLEANRITLDLAPADVGRLVRDVVALMAAGSAGRDLEVKATVAEDVPPVVVCDAARLRQVLINLVGNAVKFTEAGCVEASLGYRRGRRRPADGRGARHRRRHPRGGEAAALPALRPGRLGGEPPAGRHRPRARHLPRSWSS